MGAALFFSAAIIGEIAGIFAVPEYLTRSSILVAALLALAGWLAKPVVSASERKKPSKAFWTTIVLVALPALYVLSIRPACWLVRMEVLDLNSAAHVYRPIVEMRTGTQSVARFARWYSGTDEWGASILLRMADSLRDEERSGRSMP